MRRANDGEKRKLIKSIIMSHKVDLVCLKETKVQEMSIQMIRSLGVGIFLEWEVVEARGLIGDILVFWDNRVVDLLDMEVGVFSISCCFKPYEDGFVWMFGGFKMCFLFNLTFY